MPRKVKAKKMTKPVRSARTMTAKAMPQQPMTNFMQLITATITFWLSGAVLLLLANLVTPGLVVLGTNTISGVMGALYAGGVIALVGVSAIPVLEFLSAELKMKLGNMHWMLLYLIINTGAIWLVSRFAELVGFGIGAWWVAVVLGVILDMIQGWLMTSVVSKTK